MTGYTRRQIFEYTGTELDEEFRNIESALQLPSVDAIVLAQRNAAPAKPEDGMIAYADGTNWAPGGAGVPGIFAYYAGAWNGPL